MKTSTLKILALSSVAVAAIAVPVSASHNSQGLRGMFSGQHAGQGQYISQQACNPCGWQAQRLQKRVHAQPTYVTGQTNQMGLRGYSHSNGVRTAQRQHAQINLQGPNAHTQQQYRQLAQLGYRQNYNGYDGETIAPSVGQMVANGSRVVCIQGQDCTSTMISGGQSQPQYTQLAALDYGVNNGQNYGAYYDPAAAQAFHADRSFNVGGASVRTSVANSARMLDWQENTTGKALNLLANRSSGVLEDNALYIGGAVTGSFMYQKTSDDGLFPILSRFPFFSERTDDEAGVFAINNAALSFTSTFGDWTTMYMQAEYSETEYGRDQDEFQLRKAYVVFGNLDRSPFYAAFGRKTIDFGNFDSYNAFTHNEGAHYFWAVSDQPVAELGFYKNGFKVVASALSGGRQLRVAFADENNNIANYAVSAEKEFLLDGLGIHGGAFTVGGGYLHDTIYRDNFTAHTFRGRENGTPPANLISGRNGAVNAFAEYNSPFFDAMVEYTKTLKPWAAAIPQLPDGTPFPQYLVDPTGSTTSYDNINFDEDLSVLVAQARIKPMVGGKRMAIAASGSWGNISDDFGNPITGTTFEKNQQHALSVEYPINDFLEVGAEYVYNKGFIPFVAPQLVSNDETEAHAVNVGFKARF